jgi:hypothetical protein
MKCAPSQFYGEVKQLLVASCWKDCCILISDNLACSALKAPQMAVQWFST